jgi:hypothetical protein
MDEKWLFPYDDDDNDDYLRVIINISNSLSSPSLWSSGQSSWLQIQRSGFNSQSYQISR